MKKMLMAASVPSMIGQFNMNNIRLLLEMGYEVHVACNFRDRSCWPRERIGIFLRQLKELGVRYHQIAFSRSPKDVRKVRRSLIQLDRLLVREKYGLVHCHTPMAGVLCRICCHRHGVRVIYTAHGFHFYHGAPLKNWILYYPVERVLSRCTDILITINKEDYRRAKKEFHAKKVVYVPGVGIDIEKFDSGIVDPEAKRAELGIKEGDIMLLSVGELSPRKNHEAVIRALAEIQNSSIQYFIVGEGAAKDRLELLVQESGLSDQVHFLNYRMDISGLCQAADLFVFPSRQEGLPVALMEAVACRTPVACSRIRGNTDLVSDARFLFDENSVDDMVRVLKPLVKSREAVKTLTKDAVETNYKTLRAYDLKAVEPLMKKAFECVGGV